MTDDIYQVVISVPNADIKHKSYVAVDPRKEKREQLYHIWSAAKRFSRDMLGASVFFKYEGKEYWVDLDTKFGELDLK